MKSLRGAALPPTTNYWSGIVNLHNELSSHAAIKEAGWLPEDGWDKRIPGVRRKSWPFPEGGDDLLSFLGNGPYWRGINSPIARLGMIDIVDSSYFGGPFMHIFDLSDSTSADGPDTMRFTSHRLVYAASKIGGVLLTQDRFIDGGSSDDEPPSPAHALIGYAKGQLTGYQAATLNDYNQLEELLKQGIAAGYDGMSGEING